MKDTNTLSRMDFSPTTEHCEQVCCTELVFDAEFQQELISLDEVKNVTEMCSLSKWLKKRIVSGKWEESPKLKGLSRLQPPHYWLRMGSLFMDPTFLLHFYFIEELWKWLMIQCMLAQKTQWLKLFWWSGMNQNVTDHINKCSICLRYKNKIEEDTGHLAKRRCSLDKSVYRPLYGGGCRTYFAFVRCVFWLA